MYNFYDYQNQFAADEIIIYLRKSRSDDPTLSVEEVLQKHETILNEWAEKNISAAIPENNRYREVVSGETIEDRPEIQTVLKCIESPKIKAILVVEVQRLSRGDLEDAGRLIKLLRYTNTVVITPQKNYDLSNEYDRDIFERELKRGNEFLEYQKKIMNRGRLLSVSQGNFIGSIPPYGYDRTWVMDGKRKCPTLKENKEQADIVRMIFDMYVNQDLGRQVICNRLEELGVKSPHGEYWSPYTLIELLSNVHYIGKVKWNWRKTLTVIEDGEAVKTRPKSKEGDYLIYDGKHEAIISQELFDAAQAKRGKNHRAKAATKIRNPLASLLFCRCGKAMTMRTYKSKDGNTRCAPRLICNNQTHCHNGSCLFDEMIEQVCSALQHEIADFEIQLKNNNSDAVKLHANVIKSLENKLKILQAKELSQWEAQADPDPVNRMPQEIFKQLNTKLLKEKEETQQALNNAYETAPANINYEEKIKRFTDALTALQSTTVDAQTKNKLLKACIKRIEYSREQPKREKKLPGEKAGTRFKTTGGYWLSPPFEIKVEFKI